MCGGGEALSGACNEVIEQDFPDWHAWNHTRPLGDASGEPQVIRAFARRPRTSPPVVIGRDTEGELRVAIQLAERRFASREGYWRAVMAARQVEVPEPEPALPRRDPARSYWPAR